MNHDRIYTYGRPTNSHAFYPVSSTHAFLPEGPRIPLFLHHIHQLLTQMKGKGIIEVFCIWRDIIFRLKIFHHPAN